MVSPSKRYSSHLTGRLFAALGWEGIRAPALCHQQNRIPFFAHENRPLCRRGMCVGSHAAVIAGALLSPLLAKLSPKCSEKIPCEPPCAFPCTNKVLLYETPRFQGPPVSHRRSEPEFSALRMLCSRAGKPSRMNLPAGHRQFSPSYEPGHAQVN